MKNSKLKFQSYDGTMLNGVLQHSEIEEVGGVLFVHGITSEMDELGFHSEMAKFLAKKGITSLRFNYRYHSNNSTDLENLTLSGIVNDIDIAYNTLRNNIKINSKLFLIGTSFGGGLSIYWASLLEKNEISKIVLNAPVIDYEDDVLVRNNLKTEKGLSSKAIKQLNNTGFINSSGIRFGRPLINELRYINGIQPLQKLGRKVHIFHGADDDDVPLSSSEKFKSSKTILHVIPNVGHGFGIDIDEDLTHPETKAIHKKIYEDVWTIFKKEI